MMQSTKTLSVLLIGAAMGWMASVILEPVSLRADDRRDKPKVAFKSGGERSVLVLEKISKQINTMDSRLAAIEAAVTAKSKKQ